MTLIGLHSNYIYTSGKINVGTYMGLLSILLSYIVLPFSFYIILLLHCSVLKKINYVFVYVTISYGFTFSHVHQHLGCCELLR